MGKNNNYKYLSLSVSALVVNFAVAASATESIPIPSLKPGLKANEPSSDVVLVSIPAPNLKPRIQTFTIGNPTSVLSNVTPRLKPQSTKNPEITLLAQVSVPSPQLKNTPETSSDGKVYGAAFFDQYAPVNAADMVAQVPNFTLTDVDAKRGLGQGGANVLINGVRLTGKDNDARAALTRIPASTVERIEIRNGAELNIPGLSGTVANIVTNQDEFGGSWKYSAAFQDRSRANLFGVEASIAGSRGALDYVIGFESGPFRDTEVGPETITNGMKEIVELRDERALAFEDNPKVSAELTYTRDNGHIAHLNANYQVTNFRVEESSIQSAITNDGTDGQRLTSLADDGTNGELGADYAFDIGAGSLKLIGITRYSDADFTSRFKTFDFPGNDNTSVFKQASQSGESIVRGEYSFKQDEARDWQFAIEGAFNFLEIDATLAEANSNGILIDVPFPGSSSRVEEKRAETVFTHNWKVSEKFSLQASAGVEFSELSQTGPSGLTREFVRPKGLLSTSYTASNSFNIRTKVERAVGQLDFGTFISSVSLADDLANAGNPEIVPAQSWDGEIEFEKTWPNGLSATLKLYGQKIEDVVDRIPLPGGGDAPGNIDNAEVLGFEIVGTALLDTFGLKGARLDLQLAAENSSVLDPLTGLDRRLSTGLVSSYNLDFRHDIPHSNWAWGGHVTGNRESADYRLRQISHFTEGRPEIEAFIEHKDILGLTVRADIKNLLSSNSRIVRNLFNGDNRVTGSFIGAESRVRTAEPRYGISISGTF